MLDDHSQKIQVTRTPEGDVTIRLPAGYVDWSAMIIVSFPILIDVVEQIIKPRDTPRDDSSMPSPDVSGADSPPQSPD
jgi:hypothetical protein